MNDLQVFQNSEFGELRVLEQDGKPYFPATACAKVLGYKRPADAITAHCKGSVKYRVPTNGGNQEPESVKLKRKPFSVSSFLCSQILLEIAELCGIVQSEFGFSSEITLEFLHPMGEEIL